METRPRLAFNACQGYGNLEYSPPQYTPGLALQGLYQTLRVFIKH